MSEHSYPGKGHPWSDFLHHRLRAIKWAQSECGDSISRIVQVFSCDEVQMRLLLATPIGADGESAPAKLRCEMCPHCNPPPVGVSEHERDYVAPFQVALRKAPGAALCVDDGCDLSGRMAHVGPCEACGCGKDHAIDECPDRKVPR